MEQEKQQQPQIINPEELFAKVFEKKEDITLPNPPQETPASETTKTEEVKAEEVIKQTDPPLEEVKTTTVSNYSKRMQNLISDGFLEDVTINIDGEDVFLSEVDIKDEDTYRTILESIKEEKDNKLKENFISKEGLDETTQKLIEIRKAGGDITEIVKENVNAIDQLTNLKNILSSDDTPEQQKEKLHIDIVAQDLQYRGLSPKVIQAQINDFIESGNLEVEADKILNTHLELHNSQIEEKRQLELERLNKEKEELKNFKKDLSSTYKTWNLPDNISRTLLDNATKLDQDKISNTDKLYFEAQKNPELFAKVNFLLNNPNEFEKWVGSKKSTEAKKEIIKSSIVINTNRVNNKKVKSINSLDDIAQDVFNK